MTCLTHEVFYLSTEAEELEGGNWGEGGAKRNNPLTDSEAHKNKPTVTPLHLLSPLSLARRSERKTLKVLLRS